MRFAQKGSDLGHKKDFLKRKRERDWKLKENQALYFLVEMFIWNVGWDIGILVNSAKEQTDRSSHHGVVANMPDCDIIVSEFKL